MVKEKEVQKSVMETEKAGTEKESVKKTKEAVKKPESASAFAESAKPKKAVKGKGLVKEEKVPVTSVVIKPETQVTGKMSEMQLQKEFKKRAGIIQKQMNNIQQSFLIIAFQLHWIKDHDMYASMGYKNIYEYAEMEYGIGRSSCGNFICIIDNFAKRDELGNVVESIAEQYQNFTSSQLVAMIGMSEEGKKRITPDMSVRLINRIRKQEAQARIGTMKPSGTAKADRDQIAEVKEAPADVRDSIPKDNRNDNAMGKVKNPAATAAAVEADADMSEGSKPPTAVPASESSVNMSCINDDKKPTVNVEGVSGENKAESGAKGKQAHRVVSTLLAFDSYSNYQKELEHIHELVAGVFKQSAAPVTVKIVCERGIA